MPLNSWVEDVERHGGRTCNEFRVEDRKVQWLVNEDVNWRRMEYSPAAYLKGDISSRLCHWDPEYLPVAETLYDMQL